MRISRLGYVVPMIALTALASTACGTQTDERVADTVVETPAADGSDAQSAPQEGAQGAGYISLDCATSAATPTGGPPPDAEGIDDSYAAFQPDGVPTITIPTAPIPVTALGIADVRVGDGAEVQPGATVTVNYCGVGLGGQTVFDSSWSRGEPISFPLDNLIPGWQEGIPGMRVGGQRLLVIPGELGYGENGAPGIAPNETLVFVIELLDATS
jgi:peptidylprolyl isomerase